MRLPTVHHQYAQLSEDERSTYEKQLRHELEAMRIAGKEMYGEEHASINLSLDTEHLTQAKSLAAKYKNVSLIIVIGIGGSNLGTVAVQEAVLGKLHNLAPGKLPRILYADTVDTESLGRINAIMAEELRKKHTVVLNAISKSGSTTETIANFEVLLATLAKYKKSYRDYVVVTTEENSPFWQLAKNERFQVLHLPKNVGGRYSVFSPVGLFPLALVGVDVHALLDGAAHMRAACLREPHENPAILRAAMLAHARSRGHNIADNFYFRNDFESIGKWYRQLMGESIGKEWNKDHSKQIWMGITPTVSIGSTDLHSMAQLYFGGPKDKFFTLVTVDKWSETKVPRMQQYDSLVPHIQGQKLSTIMHAISDGVAITLQKQDRPFCVIELPDASEASIGALLQLHMMEMMYLAALVDVNAFDQPNVESYKIETKRILARK